MLNLIANLIRAATAYFEYKNRSLFYDISEKSKNKQEKLINEIQKLRDLRTQDSNASANVLLLQLESERKYISDISAYYSKAESK
jgi:galactose-1-phosphate uridylyltransferase